MRFDKPIGIFLLLWPTLWGLWIASGGYPGSRLLVIFIVGTVIMRAAGCVINDYFDEPFDGLVKRTRKRVLVTAAIPRWHALVLFLVLLLLAGSLLFFLNTLAIQLAVISALMTMVYPLMKRFTNFPQVFLGLVFSMGIPIAYASVTNELPLMAWILYALSVMHTIAFDTIYAMVDKKFDKKIGIHSMAVYWGDRARQYIFSLQILCVLSWIGLGIYLNFNVLFYLALLLVGLLFIYQYHLTRALETTFQAFLYNNWVGVLIFLGIVASNI